MTPDKEIPKVPHVYLDGKWSACLPADDFGFLGERFLCALGGKSPQKKLLIRKLKWRESESNVCELTPQATRTHAESRCPVVPKTYRIAFPLDNGGFAKDNHAVFQQDVSVYTSLKHAVTRLRNERKWSSVWKLFYAACRALRDFGEAEASRNRLVPLQFPSSLGVNVETGDIALLDAEFDVPKLTRENRQLFEKWFGPSDPQVSRETASLLHAKALLLYFRELIGAPTDTSSSHGQLWHKTISKLDDLVGLHLTVDELAANDDDSEDWSLTAEDDAGDEQELQVKVSSQTTSSQVSPPIRRPRDVRRSRSLVCFLALLLIAGIVAAIVFWPRATQSGGSVESTTPEPSLNGLEYAKYVAIVPSVGASVERVRETLGRSFANEDVIAVETSSEAMKEHAARLVKDHSDHAGRYVELIDRLQSKAGIRLKNYGDNQALNAVLEQGGVWFIGAQGGKAEYRSLMDPGFVEHAIKVAELSADQAEMLRTLRATLADYVGFQDALALLRNRPGFLVRVEPTQTAHAKVRQILSDVESAPFFSPRPLVSAVDAIDSATGSGGGTARYVLSLDRPCYWRQVGAIDRAKVDYLNNPTNTKMKWQSFPSNARIQWRPIGVLRASGRTDSVSTFDIAVVLGSRVVLFRNQSILVAESADAVRAQVRSYLVKGLGIENYDLENAVFVRREEENVFTGALIYSYLAGLVPEGQMTDDVSITDPLSFDKTRSRDDKALEN
jgi:hypothetical protein